MTPQATTTLTIAVLTFKRPDDIEASVPLLLAQARQAGRPVEARVLVVDNDPAGSARAYVEAYASSLPTTEGEPALVYAHEATPGITAARNRALTESAASDLLVFIDDDERPSERWLAAMLDLQASTGCAAVAGPVVSEYEVTPEPWIEAGRFFVRNQHETGHSLDVAATNNLLLDLRRIREWGLSFDLSLGTSGGGDTLFTRQIVAHGGTMLWAAEASVIDVVPKQRLTRRWVVLRAFRSGNSWSKTSLMLTRGAVPRTLLRLRLTARGLVRAAGGLARIVAGVATNSIGRRARGTRTLARGAGMVTGAFGYTYREYRRRSA